MDGGKFKRRLSEVNARTESRRHNELVSKFKMAASDLVSVRGQVMEYLYIPTGIKGEMVRSGMDCHRKGQVTGLLEEDRWPFILVDRLFLVSPT